MGINLQKGQRIAVGLQKVVVGLGWDPNEGASKDEFDLDATAAMLGANGKTPEDNFFVFYNSDLRVLPTKLNQFEPHLPSKYPSSGDKSSRDVWIEKTRPVSPEFSVIGSFDDQTGGATDGDDDETIDVDLNKVPPLISSIVFSASIYEFDVRKQNFGQVQNSYIRICNADSGEELCKYELSEDFSTESAIEFGRLYLKDGAWKFEATGIGHKNGLQGIVNKYT